MAEGARGGSVWTYNLQARQRREVLVVQGIQKKPVLVRRCADKAIQEAHAVAEMELPIPVPGKM